MKELLAAGHRLECAWHGERRPGTTTLVLLHEGLGSVSLWRDFPSRLHQATALPVFVYSRTGYGNSDPVHPPRPLTYMHDEAQRVLPEVLRAANIDDCVLIGHSDGASIALIYAGGAPRENVRLRGLVLMAPHVFCEDLSVRSIAEARDAYLTPDLRAKLARHHQDVDGAFWGWNRAWLDPEFRHWNLEEYLPRIDVPVLNLQGADDQYGTLAQLDAIERGVRGPHERIVLPQCRHSPHRDQPELTLQAISRFVRKLLPPTWTPERVITEDEARALVQQHLPVRDLKPYGEGFDNTAFLVNGEWLFRFPRRTIAVPLLESELQLLPWIASFSPDAIPNPEHVGAPGPLFGWPYAGYRFLDGVPASELDLSEHERAAIAPKLGAFVRGLHAHAAEEALAHGAKEDVHRRMDLSHRVPFARAQFAAALDEGALDPALARQLEALTHELPPANQPRVLVHGDLYSRHLIIQGRTQLAGVIDWGDVHAGHPAVDLGVAYSFLPNGPARDAFFAAYGPCGEDTRTLARFFAAWHSTSVLRYAHSRQDAPLLREARAALRHVTM